jgi:Na+-driven multidrug efflux pump
MFNPAVWWFRWLARRLARMDLIDARRGQRIADLAWPRFVTMLARFSLRASDIAMVGLAVGSAGIVGISFAVVYWQFAFGIGIAGGTLGLVAQHHGADQSAEASLVVEQSVLLGLPAYFVGAFVLLVPETDIPVRVGETVTTVSRWPSPRRS